MTLLFGYDGIAEVDYLDHVGGIARDAETIRFHCRYATLGSDRESETAYVYLVPDEGFGAISLLHDRLHGGPTASGLRLDLEFTPHIEIGRLADRKTAKRLCDRLNAEGVSIAGSLDALTVVAVQQDGVTEIGRLSLRI